MIKTISKAEFVRKITNGQSLFLGVSNTMEEYKASMVQQKRLAQCKFPLQMRSCKAKSNNHLVFMSQEGESHLYLGNTQYVTVTCYATDDNILIVEQKWIDDGWNEESRYVGYKYLYYAMEDCFA